MSRTRPYQPLLLRVIHGLNALTAVLAVVTAFLVYNAFDARLGRIPLPQINDIIGIHGTFGVIFLFTLPMLAVYSFHVCQKRLRLIQPNSFTKLSQVGKPIWWYSLHRITNTTMLLAATFALISGRMMKEEWLPNKEFYHTWYQLHLIAWVVLVVCLLVHLFMAIKVDRADDSPAVWFNRLRALLRRS